MYLDNILSTTQDLPEKHLCWKSSGQEWSILQIHSRLGEAVTYWLNEIQVVAAKPGSPWGRGFQDPARLKAVTNTEALSVEKVLSEVKELREQVVSVLNWCWNHLTATLLSSATNQFSIL
ncbi:hypothetical protein G6549_24665 [Bacillus sp. MM2020_1]|nr:hypothetical protein [Bacillus sp. MM2020_1]